MWILVQQEVDTLSIGIGDFNTGTASQAEGYRRLPNYTAQVRVIHLSMPSAKLLWPWRTAHAPWFAYLNFEFTDDARNFTVVTCTKAPSQTLQLTSHSHTQDNQFTWLTPHLLTMKYITTMNGSLQEHSCSDHEQKVTRLPLF